jgi:hypothetical protein
LEFKMSKFPIYSIFLFILTIFLNLSDPAFAQGPPINTETAIISGIEGAALRSFTKYTEKSGVLSGGKTGRLSVTAVPIVIPYELLPNKLVIVGKIPYLEKRRKIETGGTVERLSSRGFGDLSLLAKYLIYQRDALKQTTRGILIGGIKFPTGRDGKPGLPQSLQNGSGSFDYTGGLAFTHIKGRLGIHADLLYTLKTEANNFEFGDTFQYDLALGWRLIPAVYKTYPAKQLNLYLELNGTYSKKNEQNGLEMADSGGNTLFLSPGIQFIPGRAFLVEASLQIPIAENLNGTQLETDYAFMVGFRWLIY